MTKKLLSIVGLVSIISLLILSLSPVSVVAGHNTHATPESSPQLVGTVTHNGMLVVFWYNNQIGLSNFIQQGQEYRYDHLSVSIYNPTKQASLNFTIEQFNQVANTTYYTVGNQTFSKTVYLDENVTWDNQTVAVGYRQISQANLSLPYTSRNMQVSINADGAIIQFNHFSIPPANRVPFSNSPVTMLIFLIVIIGFVYVSTTGAAAGFIKRAKYWPRLSGLAWFAIFFLLGVTVLAVYYEFFYAIPSMPWYTFLLPAAFMFFLINLNIWPQQHKVWSLTSYPRTASKKQKSVPVWNRRIRAVPDSTDYQFEEFRYSGFIKVNPYSRLAAIARLFGRKIPIVFPRGEEPSSLGTEDIDPDEGDNRQYILKPNTRAKAIKAVVDIEDPDPVPKRKRILKRKGKDQDPEPKKTKTRKMKVYFIPVSQWHTIDIADFLAQMTTVSEASTALEQERLENVKLKAQNVTGATKFAGKLKDTIDKEYAKLFGIEEETASEGSDGK